jgi:hypothetical protein
MKILASDGDVKVLSSKQGRSNVTKNQAHQSIKEKVVVKRLEDKIGDANGCEDGKDDLKVEILGDN